MSYFDTVIAAGPRAYWRLSQPAGQMLDAVGARHLDVLGGAVVRAQPSILPNGEGQSVLTTTAPIRGQVTPFTGVEHDTFSLEAWHQYDLTFATSTQVIFNLINGPSGNDMALAFGPLSKNDRRLFFRREGVIHITPDTIDETVAHHFVVVIDVPNLTIYVDGAEFFTASNLASFSAPPADYVFVMSDSESSAAEGFGQEFALYARALSSGEVLAHFEAGGGGGVTPGPVIPAPVLPAGVHYIATLTGAPDATSDLVLPIATANATLRTDGEDYCTVVVPAGVQYATEIYNRQNGEIVLEHVETFSDGSEVRTELARVNLQDIREDQGGRSSSVSLTGYKGVTYSDPQTREIKEITYRSVNNGSTRWRASIDPAVRPGMTADDGATTYLIDTVTYVLGRDSQQMELAQASL